MHRMPHAGLINRRQFQYCKVIIATSLVWFMIDVFLLMYFTDCDNSATKTDDCKDANNKLNRSLRHQTPVVMRGPGVVKKTDQFQASQKSTYGEYGKAVIIPAEKQEEMKKLFKINEFNLMASDLMSLNRSLPDYRMDSCKLKKYPVADLPDTSIIIVFHNEAWSTLLRTIWSIIIRSPLHLIKEIILVDDASEKDFLGKDLEDYVSQLPVSVYVVRMGVRTGLIRARLRGASLSKGQVITFLDAHCECTEGWLEPVLYEIYKNRTTVACPIIDVISDDTFEYITGSDMTWGGFNWRLNFRWYASPEREMKRRGGDRSVPMRTPTMAGGLLSIDREYFYQLGSYDSGMDIWGGENIEMSFRVWMCGGQILIVTCSRVGHVFRKISPYSWPGGVERILNHNTQRTIEVWMDRYKEFVYKTTPNIKRTDYGNVTDRVKLRQDLKCHDFEWYLENIYPESWIPLKYFSLGYVKNKETGLCLDTGGSSNKAGEKVILTNCHNMGGGQVFSYTFRKEFVNDEVCLDATSQSPLVVQRCHRLGGNQEWYYDKKLRTLRHIASNRCLGKASPKEPTFPSLDFCKGGRDASQEWLLEDFKPL